MTNKKLTAHQKEKVAAFYRSQIAFPNNVSNSNWSWIGSGPKPIDYSLVFQHEENEDVDTASTLTIVGTIGLIESDIWKTYLHLTGIDPKLGDVTPWNSQIKGLHNLIGQFPDVNGKTYHCSSGTLSEHHVTFKIKNLSTLTEKQIPTTVTNNEDVLVPGEYSTILNCGDLVIISFVPYAYDIQNYHGISLSAKTIKIVKQKYLGSNDFESVDLVPLIKKTGDTPKKTSKVVVPCVTPSTMNLGF